MSVQCAQSHRRTFFCFAYSSSAGMSISGLVAVRSEPESFGPEPRLAQPASMSMYSSPVRDEKSM